MTLTDAAIKLLKPSEARYVRTDGQGLCLEVFPTGGKIWRYRYRLRGKPETVTVGRYPTVSLKEARERRNVFATDVSRGISPSTEKRMVGQAVGEQSTVREFGKRFVAEIVEKTRKDPTEPKAALERDIYPHIGNKPIRHIGVEDCRTVIWAKKKEGYDAAAAIVRGLLKQLLDYAVTLGALPANPVAAIPMKHIHQAKARERTLSPGEVRVFLQALRGKSIPPALGAALFLILLTLVRKSELLEATWEELDFAAGEWHIPAGHSKNGRPHVVYLSTQAIEQFQTLKYLAGGSSWVLPGRDGQSFMTHNALNRLLGRLIEAQEQLQPFTVHDLRRTGSTLLHEQGWSAEVVEKALNHTIGGVRGVYNRAEYAEKRREMLQHWGDWLANLADDGNVVMGRFGTTN